MALIEMILPAMGESIFEATVLSWLKNVGDKVEADESILEVATDKVDTDVPAPQNGILKEILISVGDVATVGKPVAILEVESADEVASAPVSEVSEPVVSENNQTAEAVIEIPKVSKESKRFYSPLVRNIAKTENIDLQELDSIEGTGKDGRLTKDDLLSYVANKKSGGNSNATPVAAKEYVTAPASPTQNTSAKITPVAPSVSLDNGDEIIEMDRMRKMIADRMVSSVHTAPHVTSCVEADLTNLVNWRNKWKNEFKKKENSSLTFTPLFVQAVAKAIQDFPMINVQVDGSKIIKKRDINIGMAVALPSGNLIVPVIKNADRLSLKGLALAVNDLAVRARNNQLKPDELQGGTYTLTNIGSFGNTIGTPIINQPQVAIMAVGAIKKKPAVIETPQGDLIGVRQMAYFSHSYDHRVVDGALGGMFVRKVCDYLENWDVDQQI